MNRPYQPLYNYLPFRLDDLTSRLDRQEHFAFTKINHGFWEKMLLAPDPTISYPTKSARDIDAKIKTPYMFEDGFIKELMPMLKSMPVADPNFIFGVSPFGWKDGNIIEGTPRYPEKVFDLIHASIPVGMRYVDGLSMKNWLLDGTIVQLFGRLKKHPLVIIGPNKANEFGQFIGHHNYRFIKIPEREGRRDRASIEAEIVEQVEALRSTYSIIIMQAGILSPYLILKLFGKLRDIAFIDMGLVLDVYDPLLILKRNWGKYYREAIVDFYEKYKPELKFSTQTINNDFAIPLCDASTSRKEPLDFIENKQVDTESVAALLELSASDNHWANGGPISRLLEAAIHRSCGLMETFAVVMCANCTIGLNVLAYLVEHLIEAKPRMLVSSFGFFSTRLGPFADALVADCNDEGFLDYEVADASRCDAIVFTNIFGLKTDVAELVLLAEKRNKYLILDNAAGFSSIDRSHYTEKTFEAISFHHTKPHGFGEGGCVIVPRRYEPIIRSLLNFGVGLKRIDAVNTSWFSFKKMKNMSSAHLGATNGKISDVSCAYIYQRLRLMNKWAFLYASQARRISHIAENAGLQPLVKQVDFLKTIPGQLPFLSSRPIAIKCLENDVLSLRKYYVPFSVDSKNANYIYDHIINIPTHTDVSQIDDDSLYDLLRSLA